MHAILHTTTIVPFFENSVTVAMCAAGIALFAIGGWAARTEIAQARGPYNLDKVVALRHLCFAMPLAVFGALHLFGPQFIGPIVPRYMPWPSFWVYSIGFALIAAALSIATRIAVRWSGLLFGIMMFLFVAMIHFPGALAQPHNRIIWTVVFREMSFGGAAWILAGVAMTRVAATGVALTGVAPTKVAPTEVARTKVAMDASREPSQRVLIRLLITVGRILLAIAALVFGVEHFLHPLGLPGVPLAKAMPTWVPGRVFIDYATGAALLVVGVSILLNRKTRTVAAGVGAWLLLLLLVLYAPVLIGALSQPALGLQIEGINYFADSLLFTAAILAAASAAPRSD